MKSNLESKIKIGIDLFLSSSAEKDYTHTHTHMLDCLSTRLHVLSIPITYLLHVAANVRGSYIT